MKKRNNIVMICDPTEDIETMARLTWTPMQEERMLERRAEHRREKRNRRLCRLLDVVIVIEAIALVLVIFWNL